MQIEVFSLCDAATIDGGKLNILGAFDTIMVAKAPAVHPHCSLALRLRFYAAEGDQHNVSVKFVDADGKHIIPAVRGAIKNKFPKQQRSSSANLALNVQGLKLESAGEYSIDLAIDGKNIASLPFFVKVHK